jgi:hypothetical protein
MKTPRILFLTLCFCLLAACAAPSTQASQPPVSADTPGAGETTSEPAPLEPAATEPPAATPTSAPLPTAIPALPAEPVRIEFQASDGTPLVGYYYPSVVNPAPVVILMHWANGSQCDWVHVNLVQWLQNRGAPEGVTANPACEGVSLDYAIPLADYPIMPGDGSFAVFTFDFRGHGESGGEKPSQHKGYLQDAQAAVNFARGLSGANAQLLVTVGASIGADGAVDSCTTGCLGALSFSPGGYLGIDYPLAVTAMDQASKPAWCVVSTQDAESYPACEAASGDLFQKFVYEQPAHGLQFFQPGFEPSAPQVILDFLMQVFGFYSQT